MTVPLGPIPPFYFSQGAIASDRSIWNCKSLVQRALLALKLHPSSFGTAFSGAGSSESVSLDPAQISLIVSKIATKQSVTRSIPKSSLESVDLLTPLLLDLEDGELPIEVLREKLDRLGKEDSSGILLKMLSTSLSLGFKVSFEKAEREVFENPRILLQLSSGEGKGLLESLIEAFAEGSSLEEVERIIYTSKIKKEVEPLLKGRASLEKDLYRELAEKFYKENKVVEEGQVHLIGVADIQDMRLRIEVVKRLSIQKGVVSSEIQTFGITDQAALVEIANFEAIQSPKALCEHIKNYGIIEEPDRVAIAKMIALCNGADIARKIKNFEISSEIERCEIAKIALSQNTVMTVRLFKNYEIADERSLLELAHHAVSLSGLTDINKFGAFSETDRVELAKMAATQVDLDSGIGFPIELYHISQETDRFEIAKILAVHDPRQIANCIERFSIRSEVSRCAIAQLVALDDLTLFAKNIDKFSIESEPNRVALAKAIAKHNARDLFRWIELFKISDQSSLIEIAKIAALYEPDIGDAPSKCGIRDTRALFEIQRLCALSRGLKDPTLAEASGSVEPFVLSLESELIEYPYLKASIDLINEKISKALTAEAKATLELVKYRKLLLISYALPYLKGVGSADIQEHLNRVTAYRNFSLARVITLRFCDAVIKDRSKLENYLALATSAHLSLPMVTFAAMGASRTLPQMVPIHAFLVHQRDQFKNAASGQLQQVLNTLEAIQEATELPDAMKLSLLHDCITAPESETSASSEQIFERMSLIQFLCANGQGAVLASTLKAGDDEKFYSVNMTAKLKAQVFHILETSCGLSVREKDNFLDKFVKAFGTLRVKNGFLTYMANINQLRDPKLVTIVNRFVLSVLDGSYIKERYDVAYSAHLRAIPSATFEKWKTPIDPTPIFLSREEGARAVFSPPEFLKIKILTDRHGLIDASDKLPILSEFLASIPERQEAIFKGLSDTLSEASSSVEKAQLYAMQLYRTEDREEQLRLLALLESELKVATPRLEFLHDVQGIISGLLDSAAVGRRVVVDTDDWEDILLCGTEISGSCQRIDGTPSLNKCLLGYLMDGKIRLLAIKEGNGTMIARCLLKLLLDKETGLPVVFQERIYPDSCSLELDNALNEAAMRKAKSLGCPLATLNLGAAADGSVILSSLGSPAPYEYEDGGIGVSEGCYQILARKVLFPT